MALLPPAHAARRPRSLAADHPPSRRADPARNYGSQGRYEGRSEGQGKLRRDHDSPGRHEGRSEFQGSTQRRFDAQGRSTGHSTGHSTGRSEAR